MAIIPARGGSKRLPHKNIAPLLGRPLIAWTIDALVGSRYFGPESVYVSTDDPAIASAARQHGARVIDRPAELAGDEVWTEPVIRHAVEAVEAERGRVELVAWMNACLPEMTSADIDAAVERLEGEGLREVISVGPDGRSNSAVRVLRRDALFDGRLSISFAVMPLEYIDIHTQDDLTAAEARLRERDQDERDRGG